MSSSARPASIIERTGRKAKEELGSIEIDTTFGRMLGLIDGQKVRDSMISAYARLTRSYRLDWFFIWTHLWRIQYTSSH